MPGGRWLTGYESLRVNEVEDDSPGNRQVGALDEHPLGREGRPKTTRVSDASFGEYLRQQQPTIHYASSALRPVAAALYALPSVK